MQAVEPKFSGRIWPTGKFGVSRVRETPFLSLCESHRETAETQWCSARLRVHGAEAVLKHEGKWATVQHAGLSNVSKSPTRKKRGWGGISRHGRNMVSSAAVILERNYDKRLLSFGTVTLPHAESAALLDLSREWSGVLKQFAKNLSRSLLRRGLPVTLFGVTEIQTKRFERTGIPALHFHFCFVGRMSKRSAWLVDHNEVRRIWIQCIKKYFPEDTCYAKTENVQGIQKSIGAYLGKYMSKGAAQIQEILDKGLEDWLPSSWWMMNFDLRREVLSNVIGGEQAGNFLQWICNNVIAGWIRWFQPVFVKRSDGSQYAVGYAGTLTPQGLDKARQVMI